MRRILVLDSSQLSELSDKTKMYLNLLEMNIQADVATSVDEALQHLQSSQHYDILLMPNPSCLAHRNIAESAFLWQPDIRRVFLAENGDTYPLLQQRDYVLTLPMSLIRFYDVFSDTCPEALPTIEGGVRSKRWYTSHDLLLDRILRVLQIIREEYMNDISLNYLASRVYSSPCYLSTLFSKVVGISPMAYVNDLRMDRAVDLLQSSNMSVTDICQKVGYRNLPYFCTCFKNRYGMTPAQYRRQFEELSVS